MLYQNDNEPRNEQNLPRGRIAPEKLAGQRLADALGAASDDNAQRRRGGAPEAHHPVAVQGCREIEMGGDTKFNGSRASAC